MPPRSSLTQIRANNILASLSIAVNTLELLCDSFNTPFLDAILRTTQSLVKYVPTVQQNKTDCVQMMEQVHELLYAIIGLHITSETGGELSPATLSNVGKFAETLHKIHTFVEAQQGKSKMRQCLYHGQIGRLLKDCNAGLQQGLNAFSVQGVDILKHTANMKFHAERKHQEVLELIQSFSDGTNSDRLSIMSRMFSTINSSSSLSMLPSEPKIFHGRDAELAEIIDTFTRESPRIAILGPGGMGKSSLAKTVLHHSEITARYGQQRFFVGCDLTSTDLTTLIASHLGLKASKNLTKLIINYFSNGSPSLLILDNMETLWEPTPSRKDLEEILSLLTDVNNLALIITMRGAERPAKVLWSRPFLAPLNPLSPEAARQTFFDIADNFHESRDVDKLLQLTDNMPLAIDLIANLVDYESCSKVLARWEAERTALMSEGYSRESNLDLSISLSLSSPRITSLPQAKDLLSIISMLPDGLSDVELLQSQIPIDNILVCKTALLRTSLAYVDNKRRLKALVPIREHMQKAHPAPAQLIQPLLKYFQILLELFALHLGTQSIPGFVSRMISNYANIQSILSTGLAPDNPDLANTIYCAIFLGTFSRMTSRAPPPVMKCIPELLPFLNDHKLEAHLVIHIFASWIQQPISDPAALFNKGVEHLSHIHDSDLKYFTTPWAITIGFTTMMLPQPQCVIKRLWLYQSRLEIRQDNLTP
ncbi:hypothetical protein C8R43DRAFT_1186258 [Mycena crocata]|nr:hypothetical protein C8R43DRAFT_1186258 [Mycena crocata]